MYQNYGASILEAVRQATARQEAEEAKAKTSGPNILGGAANALVAFFASGGNPAVAAMEGIRGAMSPKSGNDVRDALGGGVEGYQQGTAMADKFAKRKALADLRSIMETGDSRKIGSAIMSSPYLVEDYGKEVIRQALKPLVKTSSKLPSSKLPSSKTNLAVSMGRLSNAGASAFSAAQSAIDNGKDSAIVIKAIDGATDIPINEKPIIIKNLKKKVSGRIP